LHAIFGRQGPWDLAATRSKIEKRHEKDGLGKKYIGGHEKMTKK
jgi:hypothetical protein